MVPTEEITEQRLSSWSKRLSQEHSTPLLMVAVGHDGKSGQLTLLTSEGIPDDVLIGSLRWVLASIQGQRLPQRDGDRKSFPPPGSLN